MMFGILTLFTGLALSAIAAWFAVIGIMAIFAGLPIYAMIMGIGIEAAKVVGITWIYRYWDHKTKLKYFMIPFTAVMMLLTSMGIFGLLSKAHIEQNAPVGNNSLQIERLDQRVIREQARIDDAETVIQQLDDQVKTLIEYSKISGPDGSRAVRAGQEDQRNALTSTIDEAQAKIDTYEDEKLSLSQELRELELEVGPIKYIAAVIYDDSEDRLEEAVRIVIIAFIFVFDPMAILLLMAGNYSLMGRVGAEVPPVPPIPSKKKIISNAKMEFVPAKVPPKPEPPENIIVKESELVNVPKSHARSEAEKAKAIDIPAKPTEEASPHGNGIFSPQFFKGKK